MKPGSMLFGCGWALVFIVGWALCAQGMHAAETILAPTRQPRVLLVYSNERLLPANIAVDEAIRSTFQSELEVSAEFYTEFLDVDRFPGETQQDRTRDYFSDKYGERPPDVIIAAGGSALIFLIKHRASLFLHVPVVHCGVSPQEIPARLPDDLIVGIPHVVDVTATLKIALRLQPDTRRVAIVDGINNSGLTQVEVSSLASKFEFLWLTNRSIPELRDELSRLPDHTVVFYGMMFRDPAGNAFTPRAALHQFAPASRVPIYGYYHTYLGHGIVGGSMVTFETIGSSAARIAIQILDGRNPQAAAHGAMNLPDPMFDWQQLRRWKISENRLPPGAVIQFRQPPFWELYRWYIIAATAVIALQAMLILRLLAQRRNRQRMELRLNQQRAELVHASRLAIVGELTASIAHEINQPLGAILSNADAAEMLLERKNPQLDEVRLILTDIRKDDLRASEVIARMRTLLRKREVEMLPLDLNHAVSEVLRLIANDAHRRGVTVDAEVGPGLPAVQGDKVHLQQVLLNLIVNGMEAMTETPEAKRRLIVRTRSTPHGDLEVAVTDAGQGIQPERLPRLFESFFTTKKEGMGLGLSIARSIIEAHHGRIWAENNPNGGATIRFTLPAKVGGDDHRQA